MSNTQALGSGFKQSWDVPLAVGKTVGKFKTVVRLDALHSNSPAGVPLYQPFQEIGGRIVGLFRIGGQKAQTSKFVNGSILEQPQFWIKR